MPKGSRWNTACKYRRRDHKKRYPHCYVPERVADVIAKEREVHPDVQLENRRKRDRDRIREKRRKAKADSNQVSATILAKAVKHQARHPKGDILSETIVTKSVKPQKLQRGTLAV